MFNFNIFIIPALLYANCGLVSNIEASCTLANETAEIVSSCPQKDEEWGKAATRKNCENITHACHSYIYHCVINAWKNATIEVCAPSKLIVGNVCAEFNFGGNKIQRHYAAKCQRCPTVYNSSNAYNYSECYDYVKKSREISKTQTSTETPSLTRYLQSLTPNTTLNISKVLQQENVSLHTEFKISIVIGVSVLMAVVLLVILVFRRIGRAPTSCGRPTLNACSSVKHMFLPYCTSTNNDRTKREAGSLVDESGRTDEMMTEETN